MAHRGEKREVEIFYVLGAGYEALLGCESGRAFYSTLAFGLFVEVFVEVVVNPWYMSSDDSFVNLRILRILSSSGTLSRALIGCLKVGRLETHRVWRAGWYWELRLVAVEEAFSTLEWNYDTSIE